MEEWAKSWLIEQRRQGKKGIEIKKISNNYYVYHSTTYWDKELKKRRKVSEYIGKLDRVKGLVEGIKRSIKATNLRGVKEYGSAVLFDRLLGEMRSCLADAFEGEWEEIYALAITRAIGFTPLKRVRSTWDKLYNVSGINPNLDGKNLSRVLKVVGTDSRAQESVFKALSEKDRDLVYDLSTVLTRSSLNIAEFGYNKDKIHVPQVNIALFCSLKTGLPTMIRTIPGSVRDIKSLYNSIIEVKKEGGTIILDRGFFSEDAIKFLLEKKMNFVLPAKRNSRLYKIRIHLNDHLFYKKRLIRCGKRKVDDVFLYLFEDQHLMLEENTTLYKKLDEGKIDKQELVEAQKHAGKILIVSNLDLDEKEIFMQYKSRDRIEKLFDTFKNMLQADTLYLQDNESVFGHIFVSFLSLYAYTKIEMALKKANLLDKQSPKDVLLELSKVYLIELIDCNIISEIPKKLERLDEKLGLELFPKSRS
jgi:transposase